MCKKKHTRGRLRAKKLDPTVCGAFRILIRSLGQKRRPLKKVLTVVKRGRLRKKVAGKARES